MRIQSKMVSILAVVSGLALTSACGEGAEGAEQQEAPAQMAPDALKEQEAAVGAVPRGCENGCPATYSDFWNVSNGYAGGWVCSPTYPHQVHMVEIYKWNGYQYSKIANNWANIYNAGLTGVCGGVGTHQFHIYLGSNGGPGYYLMKTYVGAWDQYGYSNPTQEYLTVY